MSPCVPHTRCTGSRHVVDRCDRASHRAHRASPQLHTCNSCSTTHHLRASQRPRNSSRCSNACAAPTHCHTYACSSGSHIANSKCMPSYHHQSVRPNIQSATGASGHISCFVHTPSVPENCLQTIWYGHSTHSCLQTRRLTSGNSRLTNCSCPCATSLPSPQHAMPARALQGLCHYRRAPTNATESVIKRSEHNRERTKRFVLQRPLKWHLSHVHGWGDASKAAYRRHARLSVRP